MPRLLNKHWTLLRTAYLALAVLAILGCDRENMPDATETAISQQIPNYPNEPPKIVYPQFATQDEAVAYIESIGGNVSFTGILTREAYIIKLPLDVAGDESLAVIPHFPHLKKLWAGYSGIEGPGLKFITSHQALDGIILNDCHLSDESLEFIDQLPELRDLILAGSLSHPDSVTFLGRLPKLDDLTIASTPTNDAALKSLLRYPALKELNLSKTQVTDTGLPTLAKLPNLERLDLSGTRVTSKGLKGLKGATKLRWLNVADTSIGEDGQEFLKQVGLNIKIVRIKK